LHASWQLQAVYLLTFLHRQVKQITQHQPEQTMIINVKNNNMKHSKFKISVIALLLSTGISVSSCKSKSKDATNDNTTTAPTTTAPAPVEVSGDDALRTGVTDATKDYPGVTATVNNGEITLTGSLQRSKLPDLMQRLNSLSPKKINNNLKLN